MMFETRVVESEAVCQDCKKRKYHGNEITMARETMNVLKFKGARKTEINVRFVSLCE